MRGVVLQCGRYGCIIKLADGRFANLSTSDAGHALVKRSLSAQRRPEFEFEATDDHWPRVRVSERSDVALEPDVPLKPDAVLERSSSNESKVALERSSSPSSESTLDDKIIDYLRQTSDWDPTGAVASRALDNKKSRAERLSTAADLRARRRAGAAKKAGSKKH
jgi:hypothetical protein